MALERALNPMPDNIAARLAASGLQSAYDARPRYLRNDDLGWIARARRPETREKRIGHMLDGLAGGTRYRKMRWGLTTSPPA